MTKANQAAPAQPADEKGNPHATLRDFSFASLLNVRDWRTVEVDFGLPSPVTFTYDKNRMTPELLDRINRVDMDRRDALEKGDMSGVFSDEGKAKYSTIEALLDVTEGGGGWDLPDHPFDAAAMRRLPFARLSDIWAAFNRDVTGPNSEETESSFDAS